MKLLHAKTMFLEEKKRGVYMFKSKKREGLSEFCLPQPPSLYPVALIDKLCRTDIPFKMRLTLCRNSILYFRFPTSKCTY